MSRAKEISFSRDPFDQKRLQKAGGTITIKANGTPVFRFESKEQYEKYLALNSERYKGVS